MAETYITANTFCRREFGEKIYKIALSASTTCPNRDGTIGYGGCIFCSEGGSGDFAASQQLPVREQIEQAIRLLGEKGKNLKYIAYFQSFTGTWGDLQELEEKYREALEDPRVVGLSIATRPDCLGPEALAMLERLSRIKPLWVELGLQTIHERTAALIRRGYPLSVYEEAMENLAKLPVHRITHVILGLPGESREEMLETVRYVGERTDGIKLQLLHILKGTELAGMYERGEVPVMTCEEYCRLTADCLEVLPENIVVHRMTGDGPKKILLAPLWSGDKKRVLSCLNRTLAARGMKPENNKQK